MNVDRLKDFYKARDGREVSGRLDDLLAWRIGDAAWSFQRAWVEFEAPVPVQYFDPLTIPNQVLEIQPLLTPDRDGRHQHIFIKFAT